MTARVMQSAQADWPRRTRAEIIQCLRISAHVLASLVSAAVMLVAGAGAPGTAAEVTGPECGTIENVEGATYCYRKLGIKPQYTIWFFHGFGDSEHVPDDFIANLFFDRDSYTAFEAGLPPVNLVLISYGPSWLLTAYPDRKKDPVNATVDVFRTKIVPFIEQKYGLVRRRVVMGQSMGGFSAATLCAAKPAMWSKCVLVNPLLPSCNPCRTFDADIGKTLQEIIAGGKILKERLTGLLLKYNFSDAGWRNTRPMVLLKNATRLPKVFVTACRNDDFVEFKGPEEWINLAKSKNLDSKWDPVMTTCDHFHWPHQHVLDFLAHD